MFGCWTITIDCTTLYERCVAIVIVPSLLYMYVGGSLLKYLIRNRENLMTCESTDEDEVENKTHYMTCKYSLLYRTNKYAPSYFQYVYKLERGCNTLLRIN